MQSRIYVLKISKKSLRHVYVWLVDDSNNIVASSSTLALKFNQANVDNCTALGEAIGAKALALSVKKIRFDRSGNLYHGRVKAVAQGARKAGLEF